MSKIYVLDTNVLLNDPMALHAFHEHRVVVPMTVLEELDNIKDKRDRDVSREARIAINTIDGYLGDATPQQISAGVALPRVNGVDPGSLAVFPDQLIADEDSDIPFLNSSAHQANDNRIINVALKLQSQNPDARVCLVTKDINMRLKAKGSGLEHVEDYRKEKVIDDLDMMATGHKHFGGRFWDRTTHVTRLQGSDQAGYRIDGLDCSDLYPLMFLTDDEDFIGQVVCIEQDRVDIIQLSRDKLMNQRHWGIRPRNLEQAMAMQLLDHPDSDMTVLTGPAGSGKTLLALAWGLDAIMERKAFNKLIVARSTPPIAEDIGFLPGTEEEKMAPWLAAFEDNLEILHSGDASCQGSIDYVKERANIQFKSLNFMRGRSFNNAYIIIDEAQGLTPFQLRSIITRVGQNSRIVILGNLAQIDHRYITPLTSGLTYVAEKTRPFNHCGLMHVNGIERSRLAAFAEENL